MNTKFNFYALLFATILVISGCAKQKSDYNKNNYLIVSGIILDSCGGAPFANQPVIWSKYFDDDFHFETYTDENGYFEFSGLPAEELLRSYYPETAVDSEIEICLEGDWTHTTIAEGYLGATKHSTGFHDSNGDLGTLFAHRYTFDYRVHVPRFSDSGNRLEFEEYDADGGYGKIMSIDSSNADMLVLNLQFRDPVKYFAIHKEPKESSEFYDGYLSLYNGVVKLSDEATEEWVYYEHGKIFGTECTDEGDLYVTFKERKPF